MSHSRTAAIKITKTNWPRRTPLYDLVFLFIVICVPFVANSSLLATVALHRARGGESRASRSRQGCSRAKSTTTENLRRGANRRGSRRRTDGTRAYSGRMPSGPEASSTKPRIAIATIVNTIVAAVASPPEPHAARSRARSARILETSLAFGAGARRLARGHPVALAKKIQCGHTPCCPEEPADSWTRTRRCGPPRTGCVRSLRFAPRASIIHRDRRDDQRADRASAATAKRRSRALLAPAPDADGGKRDAAHRECKTSDDTVQYR